jgi:starch phosphorylase
VPIYLGDAAVDDIAVQACAEAQAGTDTVALVHGEAMPGTTGGYLFHGRIPGARPATDYTVRVVPYHPGVRVPTELPLVHWQK